MQSILASDKPIETELEDKLQRYGFAKRIAEICTGAFNSTSLVIGIYGKWGEGKTSMLNIIRKELPPETITINFNPWLFNDDTHLIKSFFSTIAVALGKRLKTKKEIAASVFGNYAEAVGAIADLKYPGAGAFLSLTKQIASRISLNSIEETKSRVDNLIVESNAHLVIFLDDIDRLDANEVQSVFKLVKLVGDFPRTTYILSFDDDLVASSLGPKYGDGNKSAGYQFLEKIIQIPIQLPKPNDLALKNYALALLEKTLDKVKVKLTKKDTADFLSKFNEAFVPALKNPRVPVRYSNSVGFSVPLLIGEVNISDLLIMEAIKAFYPELYHFIRNKPAYFLTSYSSLERNSHHNETEKKMTMEAISSIINNYDNDVSGPLLSMLKDLFPQLKTIYDNYGFLNEHYQTWYRERRICSPHYFERYFSYVVRKGDISDVYFDQLFSNIESTSPDDLTNRFSEALQTVDVDDFLFKLYQHLPAFTRTSSVTLAKALSRIGRFLSEKKGVLHFSSSDQTANIIYKLLEKLPQHERLEPANSIIQSANPLSFVMDIHYRFTMEPTRSIELPFLNPPNNAKLNEVLVERYEEEFRKQTSFKILSDDDLRKIFMIYAQLGREADITEILLTHLQTNQEDLLSILKIFTPTTLSSATPQPYKSGFNTSFYKLMKTFINPEFFYQCTLQLYGELEYQPVDELEHEELTDKNLVALFQKIHKEDQSISDNKQAT